ncbi:hypothetical protein ACIBCA_00060 [Kitasatospora sp. NPDC051170]|uniref:hypothetical protein n=1 Tax=Kitasatospora sp. NPDC051170 TaxID=3364056 RepID=UPI003788BE42
MPLDHAFNARLTDPDFWPRYLFEHDDTYEEDHWDEDDRQDEFTARFALGDGHALVLDVDLTYGTYTLDLDAPGLDEPAALGWLDQAHPIPHALRWGELDRLARAFALVDPELRHPGPVLALLATFTVLDENDDPDVMSPLVDAAFRHVRPGAATGLRPETRQWWEWRNLAGSGLTWAATGPDGHLVATQAQERSSRPPLYTLRREDGSFPFAAYADLLTRADRILADAATDPALADPAVATALTRCTAPDGATHLPALAAALRTAGYGQAVLLRAVSDPHDQAEACWAVETLAALPPGSLLTRWYGPSPLATARHWDLQLDLPVLGRPFGYGRTVTEDLNRRLAEAGLGNAEICGATMRRSATGEILSDLILLDILIRDDLPAGHALIAATLAAHGAGPETVVTNRTTADVWRPVDGSSD